LNEDDQQAALLRVAIGRSGPVVPDAATWNRWTFTARLDRVAPLLYELVDRVPTDLTDEQRQDIAQIQGGALSRCVQLEHHAIVVSALLAERGIRAVVLKGGATSHLDYATPSLREYSDVDLLIHPDHLSEASSLLEGEGWAQGYALPKGHERYTHAVTFVRDQMELDLHQRIAHRALGLLVPTEQLLDQGITFTVAGRELFALGDTDRLIHSCIHMVAARGANRRLSSVADVVVAATRRPHLAGEVLARAERWRVRPLVERAVVDAYGAAQLEVHGEWVDAMRRPIRRRDRLVERAYLGSERHPITEEVAYLRLMPSWARRWRYVRGYFDVDEEYAAQHGRAGFASQARYALGKLRSRE
jgi:hypothetical protein